MMTPDAGLKSTPSTSKPSEEDAQPHDDDKQTGADPGGLEMWGMHPPLPAIFNNVFDNFFSQF